jgi:Nucleotidyl transferase AbiEii toxin, Type IV TA system
MSISSVGDTVTPATQTTHFPRILGSEIVVSAYPLAMVHAEKIVTAVSRGTTSTRWRDFADMYLLARHHAADGAELSKSIREVADDNAGKHGRRRQRLDDRLPRQFSEVVTAVAAFADTTITGIAAGKSWDPTTGGWS